MKKQSLLLIALLTSIGISNAMAQSTVNIPVSSEPTASAPVAVAPKQKPKATLLLLKEPEVIAAEKTVAAKSSKSKKGPAAAPLAESAFSQASTEEVVNLPLPNPNQKIKAEQMPGLGVMPGDYDARPKTILIGTDRNELVYVGLSQTNRISTPFEDPQVVDSSGASVKAVGQDIYFVPSSNKPATIYIAGANPGQTVGLTIVPKNIPAQTIVLQLSGPTGAAQKAGNNNDDYAATDYVGKINAIIKQLCLDKVPNGFIKSAAPSAVAGNSTLQIFPEQKYSGQKFDIYRYRVQSSSTAPIELKEEAFYNESVRAVAFYPNSVLQKGESTEAFVITDRPSRKD